MTVQLPEQSTFVHAMESEALPENLDIAGECWNCTWVHREKADHNHSTALFTDRTAILSAKSAHRNVFL